MKRFFFLTAAAVLFAACSGGRGPLPRGKASADMDQAFASYWKILSKVTPLWSS